jgi:hypothetical protein
MTPLNRSTLTHAFPQWSGQLIDSVLALLGDPTTKDYNGIIDTMKCAAEYVGSHRMVVTYIKFQAQAVSVIMCRLPSYPTITAIQKKGKWMYVIVNGSAIL